MCLSLLKLYCTCTKQAVAQFYCIILKSSQVQSKPSKPGSGGELNQEIQVDTPWWRNFETKFCQPSYQKKTSVIVTKKTTSQMYRVKLWLPWLLTPWLKTRPEIANGTWKSWQSDYQTTTKALISSMSWWIPSPSCRKDLIIQWLPVFISEARNQHGEPYPSKTLHQILCGILWDMRVRNKKYPNFFDNRNPNFQPFLNTVDNLFKKYEK